MDGACRARERAPGRYPPRRPSQSVLYRCVQEHLATWLAQCRDGHHDAGPVPAYVEREFRRYLECGILAHGFARARCGQCGHDFLIAFSCKGQRRVPIVQRAAHGGDGGASHRSRLAGPAAAAMGTCGAEAAALFSGTRRRTSGCCSAPVPARGGAMPARAQPWFGPRGPSRRGRLHPPLRLHPQSAPALPLRRHRRRVRRRRRRAGSSSMPPPGSMPTPSPRCRRRYASGCCASSCAVACCRRMTQGRWRNGHMAAAFPSMRRCASRPLTVPDVSGCCAIAPGHRSPWTGCANSIPSACSTRAPNPFRAGTARCS